MELKYIKANGKYYFPTPKMVKKEGKGEGCFLPVLYIKKLMFGRWQIDYFDEFNHKGFWGNNENQTPNTRVILYPSGIEEIKYKIEQ